MKPLLVLIVLFSLSHMKAAAQQSISIEEALKNMANHRTPCISTTKDMLRYRGKLIYVCDTIKGGKTINDTLRLLYLGGTAAKPNLIIVIKSLNIYQFPERFVGRVAQFSGEVCRYKETPSIVVISETQTEALIEI